MCKLLLLLVYKKKNNWNYTQILLKKLKKADLSVKVGEHTKLKKMNVGQGKWVVMFFVNLQISYGIVSE